MLKRTLHALLFSSCLFAGVSQAQDVTPPVIQSVTPAPGSTVSNLSRITVTFSEPVAGQVAADLLINNDSPATSIASTGAVVVFDFSQPKPGTVTVSFDPDTVITDLSGNPFDPFAPNGNWSYTLADTIAPVVALSTPAAGATVRTLTQVEVVFGEPVSGVDAADLRINGQAATSVTAVAAERYVFGFPQPTAGVVTITWAGGHGIQDMAPAPNSFGGSGWAYTLNAAAPADVVINEILTDNLTSLVDEDGQKQDWIELYNRGSSPVNLLGWSLTDDAADPGRWTFPNLTLGGGQYLLVFASGKNRKPVAAGTTNHTNFRLNPGAGYVGLFGPESPRVTVSELAPAYPEQRADVSYGRAAGGALTYFGTPTPRATNSAPTAVSGFAQPPHASVKSGLFNQPFNLVLSSETPGADIRYTLDGKPPTVTNILYTGPIPIAGTPTKAVVMIRAAAFKTGLLPSLTTTRTYIFPDHVLTQPTNPAGFPGIWDSPCTGFNNCSDINPADYEMDPQVITNTVDNYRALARQGLAAIPTVSIVTDVNLLFGAAEGVYVRREPFLRKPVSAEFITTDGSEGFQIDCGMEMQGQTSPDDSGPTRWKSLKLGLRLFFQGEFGPTKLRYKVFENSPVKEFDTLLLGGGHNNYWNYNNNDTQRIRAVYVRDQFAADLQNALGGRSHHGRFVHLYLNGLYWGLYQLHERPDEDFQASYFGGEKADYDVFKHDSSAVVAGSTASYSAMWTIINSGLTNNAVYEQLQQVLDVPDLVNYLLVNYWANNTDWDHKNLYASHRKVGGKWRFHAWDSEHVLASATNDFAVLDDNNGSNPTAIFKRLLTNAEFRVVFADLVHKHFFNDGIFYVDPVNPIYNPAFPARNPAAHMFVQMLQGIDTAIVCESARWGDVGPGRETTPHTRNLSFYEERDILLGTRATFGGHSPVFFPGRSTSLLNQFRTRGWYPTVVAPKFSRHGGNVTGGFNLYMTNLYGSGTLYYTTNGTDPRVYGSGSVSPHAVTYPGAPLSLGQSMVVKARTLVNGTNWSALNEAAFTVGSLGPPVRLVEIMFNPPGGDFYEFIELQNTGVTPVNLGGWTFEGIGFIFPPYFTLPAGARIVLASDELPSAFAVRYPGVQVSGWFDGSLDNGGERLALRDGAGNTVFSVDYDDAEPWPVAADGPGYSLEILDVNGDPDDPANWRAASVLNGTPGQPPSAVPSPTIVLNEIMAENLTSVPNGGAYPDWIELRNAGPTPVNLTGWSLTDNGNPRRFIFASGPTLNSGDYLVVWCDTNSTGPGLHTGFALDRDATGVFLYDANTNRADAITLGAQMADFSVGRVAGDWRLNSPTPNAANSAAATAAVSSLVINEWLANAAPGASDWIELHNTSSLLPVALRGLYLGSGSALHRVTALSFIRPGGFLQLLADEQPGPRHVDFKLASTGGAIVLSDSGGTELNRATYGAQGEGVSQGRLPDGAGNAVLFPGSASPGAGNYLLSNSGVVLNEVLTRNTIGGFSPWGERADWIELANTNGAATSLAGVGLGDSPDAPKWIVPAGVSLAGNSQLRLWCDGGRAASSVSGTELNSGFSLSAQGGGVFLFGTNGQLMDFVEYGVQAADLSIGRSGGAWRLLASPTPGTVNSAAAALGNPASLRFNEWLSNPSRGNDWFELFNTNAQPVVLSGLYLTDDPSLYGVTQFQIAPLSFIGPRGFVRFHADGDPGQGRDHVNFNLDGLGDALRLYGTNLALLDSADFGVLAFDVSQGRLPDGSAAIVSFPTTATPGTANYLPVSGVVINEVLARPGAAMEDAIELYNPTAHAAPLGGWFVSDSETELKKFRIPDGSLLAGGAFTVLYATQFNHGGPGSFALDGARGGMIYLSEADGAGNLTGFRAQTEFGAAGAGVSLGRLVTCNGARFTALAARTLGQDSPGSLAQFRTGAGLPNAPALSGPIALNEIHYHPPGAGDGVDEFIEMVNTSAGSVPLYDPANPANTWNLRGGVDFDLPPGLSLPAGGHLVVVGFDPVVEVAAEASFRTRFSVPPAVPIVGPWRGDLANGGEAIELRRPDAPLLAPEPGPGYVPQLLVDRVEYSDTSPWPTNADGGGHSLQRVAATEFGDDAENWAAAVPTAGAASAVLPATAPTITEHPFSRVAATGSRVAFGVAACGSRPLSYQWKKAGANMAGETNAAFIIASAQAGDAATYTVLVSNGAGNATGGPAVLTLGAAPTITAQPAGTNVAPGSPFTLTVGVSGTPPLSYQWRRDGLPMSGATNPVYTVASAQPADVGGYSVVVANGVGIAVSATAQVVVVVPPNISEQPTNVLIRVPPDMLANPSNRVAVFRVNATSVNPPLTFHWRFNGALIPPGAPDTTGMTSNILTITNVQFAHGGDYDCVLTDGAGVFVTTTARLIPIIAPIVIQATTNSMTNVVSSTVTLSAGIFGSPPPFVFVWRSNSSVYRVFQTSLTNDFMTFGTMPTTGTMTYRVEVTNFFGTSTFLYTNRIYFTNYIVADADADGLPDYYEAEYGALNPGDDSDGDRMTNLAEYLAGTDPLDDASYLKIDSIAIGAGTALAFGAIANRTYTIQYAPVTTGGPWSNLVHVVALPTNRVQLIYDSGSATQRFYRAVTPRQP